jgi:hypothetical protein
MNDIWHFFLGIGAGFNEALSTLNPLPVLIVAILIGLFQPKADRLGLKALAAVLLVLAFQVFAPVVMSHSQARWPDLSHIGVIVDLFLMYVFAYGMIGVLGSLKGAAKLGAAKAAH